MYAIVPPPPKSTLPNSDTWYLTLFSSNIPLTFATNSALASDAPELPREPVYLLNSTPYPINEALFF